VVSEHGLVAGGDQTGTVHAMATNHGVVHVKQTERLVAALRPVPTGTAVAPQTTVLSVLRPFTPPKDAEWLHGFARLDASGRVRDAVLFVALGWTPGTGLALVVQDERVIVRKGDDVALDERGRLTVPERCRALLTLAAGDGVLCSADTAAGVLVLTPARFCDQVVAA
jgi:bifunctional DNA-binding transcriptional regulator/antitoxin component of YhaV-PrlF toxin-antitoxin module